MSITEIARNTAWNVQYEKLDEATKIIERAIEIAIEKAIAPIEKVVVETRVKAAALQRELDEFQQKLDAEVERRLVVERFVSRLRENQAFDRAAREVWKKQLETVTELFQRQHHEKSAT